MINRLKVRKEVSHGGVIPRGWQLAWYEPRRRIGVYYPAPLHCLLRGVREVVHRVRSAVRAPGIERAEVFQMQRAHRERERLAEEYARGYMAGWRECFQTCLSAVEEEIARVWTIPGTLDRSSPRRQNLLARKTESGISSGDSDGICETRRRPPRCLEKERGLVATDQQTTGGRRQYENL